MGAVDLALDPHDPGQSTHHCGPRGVRRGQSMHRRICLAEDSTSPPTAAIHGISLAADFPPTISWARSASPLRPAIRTGLYAVVDDLGTAIASSIRGGPAAKRGRSAKPSGGIYLSDDAGATWRLVNNEQRLWGRGWYFGQISCGPDQSRSCVRHQYFNLHDARCRQDMGSRERRAGRRRLSPALDQSEGRQSHGALQRSGHRGLG